MRYAPFAGVIGTGVIALAILTAEVLAHSGSKSVKSNEMMQAFKGKVCTTKAGAKFMFGEDGRYSYEGLWSNAGRYSINDGAITVILDSGLERSFLVSRKGDAFYLEQTAVSCK